MRHQDSEPSLPSMEPIKIQRSLISHVHNVSWGDASLVPTEFTWSAEEPLDVSVEFISTFPSVPNVEWSFGVEFLQEALAKGRAGHPNISPCLAEVSGEDFVLTLRGFHENGQVVVSNITLDLEQIQLFVQQIEHLVGELDYQTDINKFLASFRDAC